GAEPSVARQAGESGVGRAFGKGSTFPICLPGAASPEKIAPAETVATPFASVPQIAPGAQILVVDDSSQVREVLRELLDRYGHTVVCCEDGESGLVEL